MISLQKYKSLKLESCHQGVLTDLDELMNLFPILLSPFAQYDKDLCFGCMWSTTSQWIKQKQTKKKSICQSNIAMMATASIYIQAINFILCY